VIAGHTSDFDIGGGPEPGVLGTKRVSQFLCGMPIAERGEQTFKPIPALSFIRY